MNIVNLWSETERFLGRNNYSWSDVIAVCGADFSISKENFEKVAKETDYDNSWGSAHVAADIKIILKDGAWLDRAEYDGSEWWELRKLPTVPKKVVEVTRLAGRWGGSLEVINSPEDEEKTAEE